VAKKKRKTAAMAVAATETIMHPEPILSAQCEVSVNRAAASSSYTRTPRMESRTLEGDNLNHRHVIIQTKLADALSFIRFRKDDGNASFDVYFSKFNYQNYYDVNLLLMIGDELGLDLSLVTSKSRYSHKVLLTELINKLL
jgi:hypothetical protein